MDDEAQKRFQRAIELEPDTVQARAFLAQLYMAMGKDEKALEQAETILNLYPNEPMGLDAAGRAHWFAGQIYKAGTYFRQNMEQSRIALAQIAGSSGHQDEAEGLLAPLVAFLDQTLADGGEASWIYRKFAGIHAVRGEINKAYEYLDRAVEAGEVDYRTLQRLPVFDRMRAEQRFQDCMAAMRGRVEEMRTRVKLQEDG
jgi:predicted Zn-dependent protease